MTPMPDQSPSQSPSPSPSPSPSQSPVPGPRPGSPGPAGSRSAVVTGSGKGIGRAVAERLTADGWLVVGLERSPGSGSVEDGAVAQVVLGDASAREAHQRAAEAAMALAPLAGWVNNAGITKRTPLHELDEDVVREILGINGFGYVWGCSAAVTAFLDQGVAGAIVNVGSIHGRASHPDHAAYEFTKGGIDALTRSVAVTYGGLGIRANVVAPGGVRTPHLEAQIAASPDPVAAERALAEGPPMGRIARAEEVAALTAFLLSDAAPYVTGQSIAVDGGWTSSFGDVSPDPALLARFNAPPR
ncbi:NAD(P)-dependent dehydrogenase (short-subunit alcohol dehydrogenase family) [Microbacterium resistens]|uniref:NAD(P)-dependent dehydrogenase (Short-subunit alcohol dehydrogenase family) n=1 Tax=Microbacterium resistens TaxID=156977 RepID=A0ABU1SBZ2_9MICO|nr:SDR family oxidoreductase [Microbacterium resistens]MDR6867096.1 NAD(P)-dependent dehydrogenase (short-subunit alcohol dehydrogenase family) [Microbacterium resistens]